MKVLIGCECSGIIRDAFTRLGHDAYSCDLKPTERPGKHLQCNIFDVLDDDWDLFIGHPVCKYMASSGAQWYYHPKDKGLPMQLRRPHPLYPERLEALKNGIMFFKKLWGCKIKRIGLENPRPLYELVAEVGNYDQIIQPWQFGDSFQKTTCLWLKGLPRLKPTNIVDRGEFITTKSGRKLPKWYSDAKGSNKEKTETDRSRTFQGIANAMAEQWGGTICLTLYLISKNAFSK
jgi:hypothetical protein